MTDSVERQRKHFNEISSTYSSARANPNHLLLKELIWSSFLAPHRVPAGARVRVMEPMCGAAEGLDIFRRYIGQEVDYHGFDYSEAMVEIARRKHPGESFEWADATVYQHKGELCDWIILIGGLHHVFAKSADVVCRLAAALRPGGHFLSFEPTQNCWLTRKARQLVYQRNGFFDAQTEQGFDLRDLDELFEQAGFEKYDQAFPGLISYVLYYNPDAFPVLNIGGRSGVRLSFAIDRLLWRTWIAKKLSFATITLWRRK